MATTTKATQKTAKKTTKERAKAVKKDKAASVKTVRKVNPYKDLSIDELVSMMQALGVGYDLEDYKRILLNEESPKKITENIIEGNGLMQKEGFDEALVKTTLKKIGASMPVKASEFKKIKKGINDALKLEADDERAIKANYVETFNVARKVLNVAISKNLRTCEAVKEVLKADVGMFFVTFTTKAKEALPLLRYSDVEDYQRFIFAFLSQFEDLYIEKQDEIQMDLADQYILHGDEARGDREYRYVLNENGIQDYIYYRYAHIYESINPDKAKAIAHDALHNVASCYTYYGQLYSIMTA